MGRAPKKPIWIIGIDEVGRGPLAGPVTVCAVAIRAKNYKFKQWTGLTDSKKMTLKSRNVWYTKARHMEASGLIYIAQASKSAALIDKKGISVCIKQCIAEILTKLPVTPTAALVLLDGGLKAPLEYIHQKTIICGDQKEKIISLASVIAKVSRDNYMDTIAKKYPQFGWERNKGYGTREHRKALKKLRPTSLHRKSFLTRILDIRV